MVGVRAIDHEHLQLWLLMGRLLRSVNATKPGDLADLAKDLDILAKKVANHFLHEERLFHLIDFAAAPSHGREHAHLLGKIQKMQRELALAPKGVLTPEAVHDLGDWLERHIKDSDTEYSTFLNLRGIR